MGAIDPITATINAGSKLLDKFVGDKDLKVKLDADYETQMLVAELKKTMGQLEINKAEAQSPSLFKGGWRPAVGWTCAIAFAYAFVITPFMQFWVLVLMDNPPTFPALNIGEMMPVLLGMLGLGYLRTDEKKSGVASK